KYGTSNWQFYSNQSNLSETTYSYYACANDTLGNENCTNTRTVTILPTVNGSSETDDLSEWWMFGRYLNHTRWDTNNFPIISGLEQTNYVTGGGIQSSPTVATGYVYVGSNDANIYQLNASNVSQYIASFTTGWLVYSSPTVVDGYVYVGSEDGLVYQLNASNISQQIANFTTSNIVDSSPAVANGYVYIGSGDKKVYQLNASNISQEISEFETGGAISVSSPAIANGYVYIGSQDGLVYQLNASNVSQLIATFTTGASIESSPAVVEGSVYIGSDDGLIYQLNASDISQRISSATTGGAVYSTPAVANGYVYVGTQDGLVYQFNASEISQLIATFTTGSFIHSTPAVTNEYLYIGSSDNNFYQLNASNISQQITTFTTGASIDYSSPAVANGYVYIGSNDLSIYQFNATNISIVSDFVAPITVLSSPAPDTITSNTTINFTFSTSDNLASIVDCDLFINDAENVTGISVSTGPFDQNITVSGFVDGTYNWTIGCTDPAGNSANSSETRNFTVDTTLPSISFISPTPADGSSQSTTTSYVNISSSDSSNHYTFVDFDSSLVLWLRMDDVNSSGDPTDLSSYGNNGTAANGATQSPSGKFGKAFSFDGTDDNIVLSRPVQDNFSICVWVNTTSTGSSLNHWQTAPVFESETGGADYDFGFGIGSDGKMAFGVGPDDTTINGAATVADGNWHHVCAIRNGGTGYLQLYNANATQYDNLFTNLSYGTRTFMGCAVDAAGNKNCTATRTLNIATSAGTPSNDGGGNDRQTPTLSLSVNPSCNINTVTVSSSGTQLSGARVTINDQTGAPVFSGNTD
ncbi:MAG: PQQ-binding-like beta-propeller repeat protein, partial [Thaumarchaeota archaeon]|nr:PQQ-binding-like beta-propeller repeat protein [Nitrososphaerota archaeon]